MNERIKELIRKASHRIIETDGAPVISTEFDKEKFAELIINECARIAEQSPCRIEDEESRKIFGHTWDMACLEAGKDIRKHFGLN